MGQRLQNGIDMDTRREKEAQWTENKLKKTCRETEEWSKMEDLGCSA